MLFQSPTLAECLVTFRTGKGLLYCVDPFIIFKSQLSGNDWSHLEQANTSWETTLDVLASLTTVAVMTHHVHL